MPLKQAGKALEFAVPILLPPLGHHVAGGFGHDDLLRAKGRGTQNPDRMVMRQDHMADRLVCHPPDTVDHLLRQTRGRLRLDHHNAVIADDDA